MRKKDIRVIRKEYKGKYIGGSTKIINIHYKQEWAQKTTLWNATFDIFQCRVMIIQGNILFSIV